MSLVDFAIANVVLAGSVWLLYRSLWKGKGRCHGCSGCAAGSGQPERLLQIEPSRRPR